MKQLPGRTGLSLMGSILKRLFQPKLIKLLIALLVLSNVIYVFFYLLDQDYGSVIKMKFQDHATLVLDNIYTGKYEHESDYDGFDMAHDYYETPENHHHLSPVGEGSNYEGSGLDRLYPLPSKPYLDLSNEEKILYKLNEVAANKEYYWLAHPDLTDEVIEINIKDYLREMWTNNPRVMYDPRLTLAVYLNEVKTFGITEGDAKDQDKEGSDKEGTDKEGTDKEGSNSEGIPESTGTESTGTDSTGTDKTGVPESDGTDNTGSLNSRGLENGPANAGPANAGPGPVVPFSWSDWVDLSPLNQQLTQDHNKRISCKYLKSSHRPSTKIPDYCKDLKDITADDLTEMSLPSIDFIPGFAIKRCPDNRASNEIRILESKSYLLTYAPNPSKLAFLSKEGVYEAQVENKKRLVDSELFANYLNSRNIQNYDAKLQLNPVKEFEDLVKTVVPKKLDLEQDIYGLGRDKNLSKINLPELAFTYDQNDILQQMEQYEIRLRQLHTLVTNELLYDPSKVDSFRLDRGEFNYLNGLKYANLSLGESENPSYFHNALLHYDKKNKASDTGIQYDWRFFNGATKYLKRGWTKPELVYREKVSMHRLIRNWQRFCQLKGLVNWIAHNTLLSWSWDGLLFPFNEGIHFQMPIKEVLRLTKQYNQTLVIEDITEGYGKYLIDCSPYLHVRNQDDLVDIRFIDVDTGMYISITGVAAIGPETGTDSVPESVPIEAEKVEDQLSELPLTKVYRTKTGHFLSHDQITPLTGSQLEGVPIYTPHLPQSILNQLYDITNPYKDHYFVEALNLFVPGANLTFLFEQDPMIKQDYKTSSGKLIPDRFVLLLQDNMTSEKVLQLFSADPDLLVEYFVTRGLDEHLPNQETSPDGFAKPLRRPLFNYEYIDRQKHRLYTP